MASPMRTAMSSGRSPPWSRCPSRSKRGISPMSPTAARHRSTSSSSLAPKGTGMARGDLYPRPAEGTWTEHYPELGTAQVSFQDSISPEFYRREQDAIFRQAWLNVGRVDDLPKKGSWFTKDIVAARASVIVT